MYFLKYLGILISGPGVETLLFKFLIVLKLSFNVAAIVSNVRPNQTRPDQIKYYSTIISKYFLGPYFDFAAK